MTERRRAIVWRFLGLGATIVALVLVATVPLRPVVEDRKRKTVVYLLSLMVGTAVACHRVQSKTAVEEAIQAHLRQQSDLALDKFTTEVQEVKFHGDTAEAVVKFQSKESAAIFVRVHYALRRVGEHWQVQSRPQMLDQPGRRQGQQQSAPAGNPPFSR